MEISKLKKLPPNISFKWNFNVTLFFNEADWLRNILKNYRVQLTKNYIIWLKKFDEKTIAN